MKFRTVRSRLWLIPALAVLLLWGCGYDDTGLVEDGDHARVVVDVMPSIVVTLDTDIDEDTGDRTWIWSDNQLDLTVHNYPRLGDADMEGGGLLAQIDRVDVTITDNSGFQWAQRPYDMAVVVEPNGTASFTLGKILPEVLQNEIEDRCFLAVNFDPVTGPAELNTQLTGTTRLPTIFGSVAV
jgi:hypothetical protein